MKMFAYTNFAAYYDLLHEDLNYKVVARKIKKLVDKYARSKGNKLLDVACGTGTHISYLPFACTGIDIHEEMLCEARKKSQARFVVGDMRNFSLQEQYDVIICLFNGVNYLQSVKELEEMIKNVSFHLRRGGMFIMEALHEDSLLLKQFNHLRTYDGKNIKIARMAEFERNDQILRCKLHYLLSERGREIIQKEEEHRLIVYKKKDVLKCLEISDFKPVYLKEGFYGNGLFIGVKKSE